MGKSSSSLKKKHSKKSSKAQKRSKSKSRRYRKKEQRKFDPDDSTSLSSSSEDSYRVRRVQAHTKRDVKGRRKRAQKRSYSTDSSEDSPPVRKKKRSKRKNDNEVREKPYKKKKIRREASATSMSSRSRSCSTCQGETASGDDSEFENHRGRSGRKKEDNRRFERGRSGSRKSNRYRAGSSLSCSQGSESFDERSEEKYMLENNSRRLRSVITVTNKDEEGGELCGSQYKEDIVDDHDYPCRSNDSNGKASKGELDHGSLPTLEAKVTVQDEKVGVDAGFGFTRDRSYNDGNQYNRSEVYVATTSESIEKKTSENSEGSLDGNDLESILRQRALENLRKFRGEIQSTKKAFDQKNKVASVRPPPISKKYEQLVANTISNNVSVGANLEKKTLVDETSRPAQKSLNGNEGKLESAKLHSTFAQEKVIDAESETSLTSIGYRTHNPELITSDSHHHSLKSYLSLKQSHAAGPPQEKLMVTDSIEKCTFDSTQLVRHTSNDKVKNISGFRSAAQKPSCPVPIVRNNNNINNEQDEVRKDFQVGLKQTSASHELPDSKYLVAEGDVDKNSAMDAKAAILSVNNNSRDNDLSGGNGLNKSQDEASQGSQFEQKTMNVMRGGEMVQVSYKVYIPKKAPALARRQLKR